ncbi:MAG TPA: ATP-binding protein [Candidatus Sulfotelmatobacter sp.]|jgi:signal transduction histidine kinase
MSAAAEIPWTPPDPKTELLPVFQNAPFALAHCQRQGKVTALNPALAQVIGGEIGMALPLCFLDLIHPQDRPEAERLFAELFGRQRDTFQLDSLTMRGNSQHVRWTVWRVEGIYGDADYALIAAEQALRGHKIEQRLRQAERLEAVGRLAGGVAHDFNNLLTGVLLYCDLLLANLEPHHRVRKYAEEIRNAGIQANGLVRQLLTVSRPPTSEPRLLSLNEIAEGMRNLLGRLIGENIDLRFQLDPDLGMVKIDSTEAQQILLNLVLNARDALPRGGRITVETANCKMQLLTEPPSTAPSSALLPCALFVVEDNGNGMDADTRTHLFEAFFTTKAGKGTGLGLATVHDIVTRNGGLIHVESAPERGTRVSVLLPLIPETVLNSQNRLDEKPQDEHHHDFLPETSPKISPPRNEEGK